MLKLLDAKKATRPIVMLVEDPGGANFVLHVAEILDNEKLDALLIALGASNLYLRERGVDVDPTPEGDPRVWLNELNPGLLIVGTSSNPDSPILTAIDVARDKGIPTVGVVDAIMSAPHRFKGRSQNPLRYAPDWLLVPDVATEKAYREIGFLHDRILVTGHPHYEAVCRRASELMARRKSLLTKWIKDSLPEGPIVVFISEPPVPPENDYRATELLRGWRTTDDRTHVALQETLDALEELVPNAYVVLRLHAREREEDFLSYRERINQVSKAGDGLELAVIGDLIIGMTSSLVFEAALIGRPTISLLVTKRERFLLPSGIDELLTPVYDGHSLRGEIKRVLYEGRSQNTSLTSQNWNKDQEVSNFLVRLIGNGSCLN